MLRYGGFAHNSRGIGRPQIILVGNGLERWGGQASWSQLVDELSVSDHIELSEEQKNNIPFPFLYELLSSHNPSPAQLSRDDMEEEEHRLASAMAKLQHISNPLLELLPYIGADHIFTTNYSYCIEAAFHPGLEFSNSEVRSRLRFNMHPQNTREVVYRLHSGYCARNFDGRDIGIWHIHGECTVPRGVVLGYDRYGRSLSRIERICSSLKYNGRPDERVVRGFTSWPELFLFGDIYVIGFGFYECEYDLWWLLRRKQRERYADGKLYFYDKNNAPDTRKLLLQSHGAALCNAGADADTGYDEFYRMALRDIGAKIQGTRHSPQ